MFYRIVLGRLLPCLVVALVAMAASTLANAATPLSVEMTLVSNNTLTMGEPIVLHYKITNTTGEPSNVYMGTDGAIGGTEWIAKKLVNAEGQLVPMRNVRSVQPSGVHFNTVSPSPKSPFEGYLVASQWFFITHPGKYTLIISVRLPYRIGSDSQDGWGQGLDKTVKTVYTQNYSFPFTVSKADSGRLQTTAETLRQAIVSEKNAARRQALVAALFSMPEAQAAASWETLALDPEDDSQTNRELAIKGLTEVHSKKSADILAELIWNTALSHDNLGKSNARRSLDELYNTGDAALKQHIQFIYDRHGVRPPKENIYPING